MTGPWASKARPGSPSSTPNALVRAVKGAGQPQGSVRAGLPELERPPPKGALPHQTDARGHPTGGDDGKRQADATGEGEELGKAGLEGFDEHVSRGQRGRGSRAGHTERSGNVVDFGGVEHLTGSYMVAGHTFLRSVKRFICARTLLP